MVDDTLKERLVSLLSEGTAQEVRDFLARHQGPPDEIADVLRAHTALLEGCGSPLAARATPHRLSIPDYLIVGELGRGGMGIVYRALELSTRREVALKVFAAGASALSKQRFLREAEIVARLKCPQIATLYRFGEAGGCLYYAMELLEGRTLAELLEEWRAAPPPDRHPEAARIVAEVSAAVDLIHGQGILHRDLKPSNVFITTGTNGTNGGQVKLLDFGLARDLMADTLTVTGGLVGTLPYMSPEQLRGERDRVDRRTDVYSLGATLYEAATLRRPYEAGDASPSLPEVMAADPEPPEAVDPTVPRDLSAVIQKAMHFEPSRRYATAGDLALDLRRFANGEPVSARPVTRWGRLTRKLRRRKRRVAGLALAVLLALAGAGLLNRLEQHAARGRAVESALEEARAAMGDLDRLAARLPDARRAAVQGEVRLSTVQRFEERNELVGLRQVVAELESRAGERSDAAVLALQRGLEADPGNASLLGLLDRLLWGRYLDAEARRDEERARRLAAQLRSYFPDRVERLRARGRLRVASRPAGARMFLFRYETVGWLLQPVPYHPARGALLAIEELPQPAFRVVRPPSEHLARYGVRLGDRVAALRGKLLEASGSRILSFAGKSVDLSGNRTLAELDPSPYGLEVELVHEGDAVPAGVRLPYWLEYPDWDDISSPEERSRRQPPAARATLHLSAACETDLFPLAFLAEGELGPTPLEETEIDAGSYLLVLRREGFRDTRVPFVVSRGDTADLSVRLFREAEVPPDFAHVPAGRAWVGGDPASYFPEEGRWIDLPDLVVGRHEVSCSEYFEFLSAPDVRAEIEAGAGHQLLPCELRGDQRVPRYERRPDGSYRPPGGHQAAWSARFVSCLAAHRFVRWKNEVESRRPGGARWTFALASADELEKVARGADGRLFPWGNGFDWSLACTYRSTSAQGARSYPFPTDASPYDVRDLAGNLAEFTRTDEMPPGEGAQAAKPETMDCRVKGGSGFDGLEPFFHLGGHTRERKSAPSHRIGFRLVAYPPGEGNRTARR